MASRFMPLTCKPLSEKENRMASEHILASATDQQLGLAVFDNLYDLFRAMANNLSLIHI